MKRSLERARIGLHDCNLLDCDDMTRRAAITTIYHLFPELAEDEDERIRKGIIRNLQYLMDRSEGFVKEDLQERIAWLEKQGESTITNIEIPFGANDSELQEVSYDIPEGFYAEIKDDRVVIKKIAPKFKVGDWVILPLGIIAHIDSLNSTDYQVTTTDGKICDFKISKQDNYHLWTIKDAKDGDVLVNSKGNPFIFTGKFTINYHNPIAYCGIGNGDKFIVCALNWRFHWAEKKEVSPATKEQRELLFQKMKEAGYVWDADKKELKKMEVASKEGDDERIRKAIHIYLDWLDGRKDYQPKGVYTIRDMIDWVIKQDKKISADKVIEWLNHHELSRDDVVTSVIPDDSPTSVPHRVKWLSDEFIKQFKKDFGI